MRLVFIKTNNVVDELRRTGLGLDNLPDGGPDAYLAHVLHVAGNNPVLLMSMHLHGSNSDVTFTLGNKEAWSFCGFTNDSNLLPKFIRRANVSLTMFRRLVGFKPSIILCAANGFSLWVSYFASKIRNVPIVYSRHNRLVLKDEPIYRRIVAYIDNWIINQSSAVICHGPFLKQEMLSIGVKEDRIYEYNWSFKQMQDHDSLVYGDDLNNGGKKKVILFIGRVQENKGVIDLYMSFKKLLHDDSIKLVYAGDGVDLEKIKEHVRVDGHENQVIFLGMVPHGLLSSIISQSRVVVTPTKGSFPEGRCMAAMEGMACGVPVVAPDFGPFPYIVEDHVNGLLYETDSVSDLTKKIELVLYDDVLYDHLKKGAKNSAQEFIRNAVPYSEVVRQSFQAVL